MQNKPNLLDAKMNVKKVLTKDYENIRLHRHSKTNPIQTQTNPIQSQLSKRTEMGINLFNAKDYENVHLHRLRKTNPIQTQFPDRLLTSRTLNLTIIQ